MERSERVGKYFVPTPPAAWNADARLRLTGGGILVGLGLCFLYFGPLLGATLVLVGGWFGIRGLADRRDYRAAFAAAEPKPTDAEMDHLLGTDLYRIEDRALERFALRPEDLDVAANAPDPVASLIDPSEDTTTRDDPQALRPMIVFGPDRTSVYARGADGIYRFGTYDVLVLCPTSHHLGLYSCSLHLPTGQVRREVTHEFHYTDIVTLSTVAEPVGTETLCRFQIVASSGDRGEIIVAIPPVDRAASEETIRLHDSGLDTALDVLRRTLREKKKI